MPLKPEGREAERRRRVEGVGARWRREGPRLRLWRPSEGWGGPGGARPGKRGRAGLGGTFRVGEEVEVALGAEQRGAGSDVGGGVYKGRSLRPRRADLEMGRGRKGLGAGLDGGLSGGQKGRDWPESQPGA